MIDRWAVPFDKGMDFIVSKIMQVVRPDGGRKLTFWEWMEENSYGLKFWAGILTISGLLLYVMLAVITSPPSGALIDQSINARVIDLQDEVNRISALSRDNGAVKVTADRITEVYLSYMNLASGFRNEYEFDNGFSKIRSKKNVVTALEIDVAALSPLNMYNFTNPVIRFSSNNSGSSISHANYTFVNTEPVDFEITETSRIGDGVYTAIVEYRENIRMISVNLLFPQTSQSLKRHQVNIIGLFPREIYTFKKEGAHWVLKSVEKL
jgi:hypothetical protein